MTQIANFAAYDTYVRIGISYSGGNFNVYKDAAFVQSIPATNADALNSVRILLVDIFEKKCNIRENFKTNRTFFWEEMELQVSAL